MLYRLSQPTAGEDGFSKEDILRRMEEDRERVKKKKRIREKDIYLWEHSFYF